MNGLTLRLLAVVIAGAALACGGGRPHDAPPAQQPNLPAMTAPEVLPRPESAHGVAEHPELVGQPRDAMVARFGPPTRSRDVRLSEGVSEMQIELLNHYPPDDPASAGVVIREDWWIWGGHTLVLWSHRVGDRWVVLETVQFTDDVEF